MSPECAAIVEKTLQQKDMGFKDDVSNVKLELYKVSAVPARELIDGFDFNISLKVL